jgi:folylpolyglutamate synthase
MLEEIISGNSKLRTGLASGTLKNEHSLGLMRSYLDSLGITQADLERLRVIQVAGSKGKGSTCGYLERLFGASGKRTGLFTSPHLVSPRERIRVNGQDISEADFASSFFHVHDTLTAAGIRLPGFFPFLTLMAFYTFTQLALDVAIIEVGIGGRFDSTNIVDRPSVAVITSLALEHTNMLGNSIDQIAWHKSGIIKVRPALGILRLHQCLGQLYCDYGKAGSNCNVQDHGRISS